METDKKFPETSAGDSAERDPWGEVVPRSLPNVLKAAFNSARGMSLEGTLMELGVSDPIARAAGRVYVADNGALVLTVRHDEVERDLDGSHVHWIDAGEAGVRRVAGRPAEPTVLQRLLTQHVARHVYVVLLQRDSGPSMTERVVPDVVMWRLEQESERWFVLRRPGARRPRRASKQKVSHDGQQ